MASTLRIGDRVAYRRAFLKSIGCYTGDLPFAKGVIGAISDSGIATIAWDHPDVPPRVNTFNLCKVGSVAYVD